MAKWKNLGDVDHRTEGARFVKRNKDTIEVVEVNYVNLGAHGTKRMVYLLLSEVYTLDEITAEFLNKEGPYDSHDWQRFENDKQYKDQSLNDLLELLATDMLSYHGDDHEEGTNYWKMLRRFGIRSDNIG